MKGFSGASHKKCDNYDEARDFMVSGETTGGSSPTTKSVQTLAVATDLNELTVQCHLRDVLQANTSMPHRMWETRADTISSIAEALARKMVNRMPSPL